MASIAFPTGAINFDRNRQTNIVGRRDGQTSLQQQRKAITAPEFDPSRVAGLAQEQQAPALAALRRNLQAVQAGRFGSLLERREAIRGATRGAGEALPAIQAGAQRAASAQAQSEFQLQRLQFQDELRRRQEEDALRREEEERSARRGTNIGGETYAQAQARQAAYDPFGASARFDDRLFTRANSADLEKIKFPPNWMS